MGWVIVMVILFVSLSLIARFNAKRKKPGRHKVADVEIYDRVERECHESGERQGEFAVDIAEISDLGWLELDTHGFPQEQFNASVKWRNQGTQCIYKFVATAGEGENAVTKHSQRHIIPLGS